MHCWHIDGPGCVGLGMDLQQELQVHEESDPSIGKCMYGGLQHRACISEALRPDVIASMKTVFQVRYLRWQVPMGSKGASLRATRNNSRHQVGSIMQGMTLVCSRPLIHLRMERSRLRVVPWTRACLREIAVTYPLMCSLTVSLT